jgi:hypothetical protein
LLASNIYLPSAGPKLNQTGDLNKPCIKFFFGQILGFRAAIFDVVKWLFAAIFDNACNLCPCGQNDGRMSVGFQ